MSLLPRRIRKYVRDCTHLSIEQIIRTLSEGRITVRSEGAPARSPHEETLIYPEDEVRLDGEILIPREKQRGAFVLFKPKNVTVTTKDPRGKRDLREWLKQLPPGFFPVGRLDRETTGALLFVNDGNLATAILRPEHELTKIYWLWLNESIRHDDPRLRAWTEGLPMLGTVGRAEKVEVLSQSEDMTELVVHLKEGKNRQIRRMCRLSDFRLLHLHRRAIGPIDLRGMSLGELRKLTREELSELWDTVGGEQAVEAAQLRALRRRAATLRAAHAPDRRLESWLRENTKDEPLG